MFKKENIKANHLLDELNKINKEGTKILNDMFEKLGVNHIDIPADENNVLWGDTNAPIKTIDRIDYDDSYVFVYTDEDNNRLYNDDVSPMDAIIVISNIYEQDTKTDDTEYVDLGLSVKWAKCNVGANSEEDYGGYYTFDDAVKLFKHRDDRMPSNEEQNELLSGTTQEIVKINGILGTKFTSKVNTNYIFIPFAGYGLNGDFNYAGGYSNCWGSSIYGSNYAWDLLCDSDGGRNVYNGSRFYGYSVRGVSE